MRNCHKGDTLYVCNQHEKCDRSCTGDHFKPHRRQFMPEERGGRDICAQSFCAYAHGAQAACMEITKEQADKITADIKIRASKRGRHAKSDDAAGGETNGQ